MQEEASLLQKCVEALLRIPHQKMILHLGRAPIISGRGIAALLRLLRQAKKLQRTLEIRGPHPGLRRTLEELGLGKALGLKSPPVAARLMWLSKMKPWSTLLLPSL